MAHSLGQGFAKTTFAEAHQGVLWPFAEKNHVYPPWPLFQLLFEQKRISCLDYALTHRLLRRHPKAGQETALFLCHLMLAAKEGHLCVYADPHELAPSVALLWRNEEGIPLAEEEAQLLTHLALLGAQTIPEGLLSGRETQTPAIPSSPICREGHLFYLQRHWVFETWFLKHLKRHLKTPPILTPDSQGIESHVRQLCQDNILLKEQAQAIVQGCLHPATLVTGGPGTGKTYTAGRLIQIFWKYLSEEQRRSCRIVLTAPTGKAAANLQRSLSKATENLEGLPSLQAKTLHALLGMKQHAPFQPVARLTADLVVVDESSMIDAKMMASLFEALKPGSRVILLGDPHQLPSVEAGSPFVDLIQLQHSLPQLPIAYTPLSLCMRTELKSLTDFAQLIRKGRAHDALNALNQGLPGIRRLHFPADSKAAQRAFLAHLVPYFPTLLEDGQHPTSMLERFQAIRVLSPLRKGPFGVESINQSIWDKISQNAPKNGLLAIPIMISANDHHQELFNGETGVLIRRLPLEPLDLEDYALFPSRQAGGEARHIPALLLPPYELAYCLSVHKSQGSEFDRVVLVLPEGAELFGREVLYTAVTRARRSIEIYGSDAVILKTIEQQGTRLSGFRQRAAAEEW